MGAEVSGFGWDETFIAENDLSALQYCPVEITAANQVDVCDAATDLAIGILQNKPKAGEAAVVRLMGLSPVKVDGSGGATISAGSWIGTSAAGVGAVKGTADYGVFGIALEGTTVANILINVLLFGPGFWRAAAG